VDKDSFEPRDEVKGDAARSIFYMAVRYKNALKMKKEISGTGFYMGNLCTLLEWHEKDLVSAHEAARHERVYSHWQKNRNPFIDYPQLARKAWGHECQ
jgi:endonuclease I